MKGRVNRGGDWLIFVFNDLKNSFILDRNVNFMLFIYIMFLLLFGKNFIYLSDLIFVVDKVFLICLWLYYLLKE